MLNVVIQKMIDGRPKRATRRSRRDGFLSCAMIPLWRSMRRLPTFSELLHKLADLGIRVVASRNKRRVVDNEVARRL